MGPLFVVLSHSLRTDLAHLIQRLEHIDVDYLVAESPIESLHKGILIGLARLELFFEMLIVATSAALAGSDNQL